MTRFMGCVLCLALVSAERGGRGTASGKRLPLPMPMLTGKTSLEEAISKRRSIRDFKKTPLSVSEIGQLCWAAQGITDREGGHRASPSAGALYPIELYVVTAQGVSHYLPDRHELELSLAGDHRKALQAAALDQDAVGRASVCMVITAIIERTAAKYGGRAERYCFLEAGHVAQNILLQATAMKLGGVPVGAFEDAKVAEVLKLPADHRVLYLLPIGYP